MGSWVGYGGFPSTLVGNQEMTEEASLEEKTGEITTSCSFWESLTSIRNVKTDEWKGQDGAVREVLQVATINTSFNAYSFVALNDSDAIWMTGLSIIESIHKERGSEKPFWSSLRCETGRDPD